MNKRLRHSVPNVRGIHATFTAIYAIIAAFFLAGPIIFVRYELMFQSGLLGFLIGIAFLMLSVVIVGRELCACHGEFYILSQHTVSIIVCSVLAAILTFYYIWNVANILSMCPQFDANVTGTLAEQTEITMALSYKTPHHGLMRRQSLRLTYNTREKCLVREHRNNPQDEALGPLKMQSFRYESARFKYREKYKAWLRAQLQTLETDTGDEEEEEKEDNDELQFSMLRNEIDMLLEEASLPYEQANAFKAQSIVPLHTTSVEEDEQFQEDRAAKICRNEKGFGIFLIGLLILCELLYVVTLIVYAWLNSWTKYLCPDRHVHTPLCGLYIAPVQQAKVVVGLGKKRNQFPF